ncbi:MAG: hypothetical protein ACWIPJ_03445 [Polaribacter sp.]
MKNYIIVVLFGVISSCTPPETGYLSNNIHSLQDTIFVKKGEFTISTPPAIEGSTYPLTWEITGITDANGNPTDKLFEKYKLLTWKEAFNPKTDSTLVLAKAKLEETKNASILINKVSGQLAFTQATKFVKDSIFKANIKVTNLKGEKELDDFVIIKMAPFKRVEFPAYMRSRLLLLSGKGKAYPGATSAIKNDFDPGIPSVLDGTHPYISVKKISDEPKYAIDVKMIIADSYGTPLNPKKVVVFNRGASYYQNYHDNSVKTVSDATSTTFSLPSPPFPQYSRTYSSASNKYLMYYLTTSDAFTVDKAAYEADEGVKGKAFWDYFSDKNGHIRNRGYIRWGIKINDSGTWEIKMKIPYTKIR